jgi:hypothetical protein
VARFLREIQLYAPALELYLEAVRLNETLFGEYSEQVTGL